MSDEPGPIETLSSLNTATHADAGQMDDVVLMAHLRHGSHDALAELYSRHGGAMHGFARRLRGPEEADDVVQDVFLRLWNRPDCFDPRRGPLRQFLMMQIHGRSIDLLRSETARRSRETATLLDLGSGPATESPAVADLVGHEAWELLACLGDGERSAIALAYFAGYTYREVAILLDRPEGTVKGQIRRGLARVRHSLTDIGVDSYDAATPREP